MASIIDALIVTLGLDTKDFKRGQQEVQEGLKKTREESRRTANDMQSDGTKAAEFYGKITSNLLKLAGLSLTLSAFKQAVNGTNDALSNLGDTAPLIRLSARELDAWQRTLQSVGGTAQGFVQSVRNIQNAVTQFEVTGGREGQGFMAALFELGVPFRDATGQQRDPTELYKDIVNALREMPVEQQGFFASRLGLSEQDLLLARRSREEVEQLYKAFYNNSQVTREDTEAAQRMRTQWALLGQTFDNVQVSLTRAVNPALESLNRNLIDFNNWVTKNGDGINGFFSQLANDIDRIALVAGRVADLLGRIENATKDNWLNDINDYVGNLGGRSNSAFTGFVRENFPGVYDFFAGEGAALAENTKQSGRSRGIRNNNPGNLKFAGQRGATKEANGPFAVFGSMEEGIAALDRQLGLYSGRGKNTIESIIKTYAPPEENETEEYIKQVARETGFARDQPIDVSNPLVAEKLIQAISNFENGRGTVSPETIGRGLVTSRGGAYTASLSPAISAGGMATQSLANNTTSSETHIGQIVVNTQATDAASIARDIAPAIRDSQTAFAYNGSLS